MIPTKENRPPVSAGKAVGIGFNSHSQYTTANMVSAIISALALKSCGNASWQGHCPACGYANAFSLSVKDDKLLWHCHACGDGEGIQHCLQAQGVLGGRRDVSPSVRRSLPVQRAQKPVDPDKLAYLRKLWAETVPLKHTVASQYLAGRGLYGPYPATLRFSPSCWHKPTARAYPAMIAAVMRWPSGDVMAIHRTFLKPDGNGKIEHPQARMMLGDATGGAVQLVLAGQRLAIAEGIETALSVLQQGGLPVWACLSTSGLQNVQVPDIVREVVICADHDPPGLKAAHTAAERIARQGRRVKIATPPQTDTDFNDILKGASHD